ncbi:MAG TPA: protein-glutamate O-methyltransferase CheR [Chitinispirillaceae bacterium]|nr:protein-glutamate O-methyltransferase CheR [Chitinispirillaceae bacterium]
MTTKIETREFELLRDYIEKHCGIHLDESKAYLVENRLLTIMIENGCRTYTEFYHKTLSDHTHSLRDKIIDAMTTNETLWFRDMSPYKILQYEFLPSFLKEIVSGTKKVIRIWSAACSTGQEPYSIGMIIHEFSRTNPIFHPSNVEIIATDISPTVLFLAKAARYDTLAISRGLSDEFRNRYFEQSGKVWTLKDTIKNMVTFKKLNLQEDFSSLGHFDIVFIRNVLIYFSDEFKKDVLNRIALRLKPDGFLIVGASESVSSYSNIFSMLTHDRALYYKVR